MNCAPKRPSLLLRVGLCAALGLSAAAQQPPMVFVANRGQWDARVQFSARRGPTRAWFHAAGWRIAAARVEFDAAPVGEVQGLGALAARAGASRAELAAVGMSFEGARVDSVPTGEAELQGYFNFYLGSDPTRWAERVPAFERLRYRAMYPGVDVVVRECEGLVEYDLELAPGADLGQVIVRCDGALGLEIDSDGSLVMRTALGPVRQAPPLTWELDGTQRLRAVACRYRLIGGMRYGFAAPQRNLARGLLVDPPIQWSCFLGGSGGDAAHDVIHAANGQVTVASQTFSSNFPIIGPSSHSGLRDGAISRLDPAQTGAAQLVWSTFLGGSDDDFIEGIEWAPQGNVILSGMSASTNFPTSANAFQPRNNGNRDAIAVQLDAAGTLLWSTYFGGSGSDFVHKRAAVQPNGQITIAGGTTSSNLQMVNPFQSSNRGNTDAFVARFDDPTLTNATQQLLWSTYLGGWSFEMVRPVAVDAGGVVSLGGYTYSTNFPVTAGFRPFGGGTGNKVMDAFISRLDPALSGQAQLLWSTWFGGSGPLANQGPPQGDGINGLALTRLGNLAVTGWTDSNNFPVSAGSPQPNYGGAGTTNLGGDAFAAWLDPSLPPVNAVSAATFIGGSQCEAAWSICVDSAEVATIAGWTDSPNFPVTAGALQTAPSSSVDGFVLRFDPPSSQLRYSTYLGATTGNTNARGLALTGDGSAVVCGWTFGANFPTTPGCFQPNKSLSADAFITQLDLLPAGAQRYGIDTPGCLGRVPIDLNSIPVRGNTQFSILCTGTIPNTSGWLLIGLGALNPGIPFPGLNFTLLVDPASPLLSVETPPSDSRGLEEFGPFAIPPYPWIAGARLYGQFIWPNPCAPMGIAASNAIDITIQ